MKIKAGKIKTVFPILMMSAALFLFLRAMSQADALARIFGECREGQSTVSQNQNKDTFLNIAHRGYSSMNPENTTVAFESAFLNGFDGIECDVAEAKNGDIMIHHDRKTTKMTNRKDYIWNVNAANRENYPIVNGNHIEKYEGQTLLIPTFEEVLELAKSYDKNIYIHIKTWKNEGDYEMSVSEEGAKKIADMIKKAGMVDKAVIFANEKAPMESYLNLGIHIGCIIGKTERAEIDHVIDWCAENELDTLILSKMECISGDDKGEDLVKTCHEARLKVGVYTTLTEKELSYLKNIGADFAMSDYVLFNNDVD